MNKLRLIKRTIFITMIILLFMGIFFFIKGFFTTAGAKNLSEDIVLLEDISFYSEPKSIIQEFDGKTEKIAYLTFDDGPNAYTKEILQILDDYNVQATFFLIGNSIKNNEDIIRKMDSKGHYVGMHSMTHTYKNVYTKQKLVTEVLEEQNLLAKIIGYKPHLYRAPYGSYPTMSNQLFEETKSNALKLWDWTVDSSDWKATNSTEIVNSISQQLDGNREVILLHDKKNTVTALPNIIELLHSQGYEIRPYNEDLHFPVNFINDNDI